MRRGRGVLATPTVLAKPDDRADTTCNAPASGSPTVPSMPRPTPASILALPAHISISY